MKELMTKSHGEKIVIRNHLGENVCAFRNIVKKSTVHFLKKKTTAFVCLGCLNNSDRSSTIEACLHGVDITSLFQKFQKNALKQNIKGTNPNGNGKDDESSNTSPADKPRHKLKDLEFEKCTCKKVICTDLANGECVDEHGLPKLHSKQQDDYRQFYLKAFVEPLKMLKNSPQNLTPNTLCEIIDNIAKLADLNIPSHKNNGENAMLHLQKCIIAQKDKRKANSFKPQSTYTVMRKLTQKFEDAIMDIEKYNQSNKFDPSKIQVVGPNGNKIPSRELPQTAALTKVASCWNSGKSLANILAKDETSESTKHECKISDKFKTGRKNAWQTGPPTIMTRLDNLLTTGLVNHHDDHHRCSKPITTQYTKDCHSSMLYLQSALLTFDAENIEDQTATWPILKDSSSDTSASSFSTETEYFHEQPSPSAFCTIAESGASLTHKDGLPPPGFESSIRREPLEVTSDPVFDCKELGGRTQIDDIPKRGLNNAELDHQAMHSDQHISDDARYSDLDSDEETIELNVTPLRHFSYLSTGQLSESCSKLDTTMDQSTSPFSSTGSDGLSLGENPMLKRLESLETKMAEKDQIILEKDQTIDEMKEAICNLTKELNGKSRHIETLMKCMHQLIDS